MALEDFLDEASNTDTNADSEPSCPACGRTGEHVSDNHYLCTTNSSNCSTVSWYDVSYELSIEVEDYW